MVSPTLYADQLGHSAASSLSREIRKSYGIYLTPPQIAQYMASMINSAADTIHLLDPSAGAGVLACAAIEHLATHMPNIQYIRITAYEIDPEMCSVLKVTLEGAIKWAKGHGVSVDAEIRCRDFVLDFAAAISRRTPPESFDVVIANPPYFKMGRRDSRSIATSTIIGHQPNIYSAFLLISALSLVDRGELIFIVPRSFASGPHFKSFRQEFFQRVRPLGVHSFKSRRQAFKRDNILQENVIFHAQRQDDWMHGGLDLPVVLSHSVGPDDLDDSTTWTTSINLLLQSGDNDTILRLPSSIEEQRLMTLVDTLPETIESLGLRVSTGPIVPFRTRHLIHNGPSQQTVPLLWMNNVTPMRLDWPSNNRARQFVRDSSKQLIVSQNCVLVRRFSARDEIRRLIAAPLLKNDLPYSRIGIENHVNYVYRPNGGMTETEAKGLAALMNSSLLESYIRCTSGNTQVSATELRRLPVPDLSTIVQIGYGIGTTDLALANNEPLIAKGVIPTDIAAAD